MALTNNKLDAFIRVHEALAQSNDAVDRRSSVIFIDTVVALKELKRLREANVRIPLEGRVS